MPAVLLAASVFTLTLLAGLGTSAQLLPPTEAPAQDSAANSAWLGIVMEHAEPGVLVRATFPGSSAAGVLDRDDVILSVDSEPVASPREMAALLERRTPGESVTLMVRRGEDERAVSVVLTSRPEDIHETTRLHVGGEVPRVVLQPVREEDARWQWEGRQRPLLLAFWATWCGSCRMLEPRLAQLLASCPGDLDAAMVAPHDVEEIRAAERMRPLPAVPLADPANELADRLTVTRLPTWILVSEEGRVETVAIGVSEIMAWLETRGPCTAD